MPARTNYDILVVEDNPIVAKMLRVALRADGLDVREATDAQMALELVRARIPDLVIQDLRLPDLGGIALLEQFRALPGAADVPVIAVSGSQAELERAGTVQNGFVERLLKPVAPSLLLSCIRAHLKCGGRCGSDRGRGRRALIIDDDPVQRRLTSTHLKAVGFEVESAFDGADGLERARHNVPDVIVSDVLMPGIDGFQLCTAVRRDQALARVPIVLASSGFALPDAHVTARQLGAHALVVRTPDHADVIAAVFDALGAHVVAPAAAVPDSDGRLSDQLLRQLDHQVRANAALSHLLALKQTELTVLSAAAEALAAGPLLDVAVHETVQRALNACGVSHGGVELFARDGERAELDSDSPWVATLRRASTDSDATNSEPLVLEGAPGGSGPALVCPIRVDGATCGVFWMAPEEPAQGTLEWQPFAQAICAHLSQLIALNRASAEAAAGREIARREELARERLRIKDEFLSHVSHELRSPLTVIDQFTTILLDGLAGGLVPEQAKYLGIINRNAGELRNMIDALLDASRSEAAQLSFRPHLMDLPVLIAEVLEVAEPSARNKSVALLCDAPATAVGVWADRARVGQILTNLVGNAIKFTPAGGSVTVRVGPDDDGAMIRVSVADTGSGIEPAQTGKVFDYLYQGSNAESLPRRGFGIGLHLCKNLVARHGGRLWVESELGRGSTFHFTLPRPSAAAEAA